MMWLRLGLIGVSVIAIFFFAYDYAKTKAKNKALMTEIQTANKTILALDSAMQAHSDIIERERSLIDEIENTPGEYDAPTAPVLLDSIKRLHNTEGE